MRGVKFPDVARKQGFFPSSFVSLRVIFNESALPPTRRVCLKVRFFFFLTSFIIHIGAWRVFWLVNAEKKNKTKWKREKERFLRESVSTALWVSCRCRCNCCRYCYRYAAAGRCRRSVAPADESRHHPQSSRGNGQWHALRSFNGLRRTRIESVCVCVSSGDSKTTKKNARAS